MLLVFMQQYSRVMNHENRMGGGMCYKFSYGFPSVRNCVFMLQTLGPYKQGGITHLYLNRKTICGLLITIVNGCGNESSRAGNKSLLKIKTHTKVCKILHVDSVSFNRMPPLQGERKFSFHIV